MSFPTMPDVDATISLTTGEPVNLLLSSVAFEELGLAHLINAETEKLQYVFGILAGQAPFEALTTLEALLLVNRSIDQTLRDIIKKEMPLEFKLEDVLTISTTTTTGTTTTAEASAEADSARSSGQILVREMHNIRLSSRRKSARQLIWAWKMIIAISERR